MTNLLKNGGFNGGYYHVKNDKGEDIPELVIPDSWEFWYAPTGTPRLWKQDDDFYRPETVVWNIRDAPLNEREVFWIDGAFGLKVFKGWGPLWWKLSQVVTGLTPGARYRFTVPIHPDLVASYSGAEKQYANDLLSGEHRLIAGATDTGWLDGAKVPFGKYTVLRAEFTARTDTETVAVEVRGRWGLKNNGWFLDALSLERIDGSPEPEPVPDPIPNPTPDPLPDPTPTPGSRVFLVFGGAVDVTDGEVGQLELQERIKRAVESVLANPLHNERNCK